MAELHQVARVGVSPTAEEAVEHPRVSAGYDEAKAASVRCP